MTTQQSKRISCFERFKTNWNSLNRQKKCEYIGARIILPCVIVGWILNIYFNNIASESKIDSVIASDSQKYEDKINQLEKEYQNETQIMGEGIFNLYKNQNNILKRFIDINKQNQENKKENKK